MAKKGLFICAGFVSVIAAFQIGSRSAEGQGPGLECASVDAPYGAWAVSGRHLYRMDNRQPRRYGDVIPGTAAIVACGPDMVILENGDVWRWNGGDWLWDGTFPFGPTAVEQRSWGGIKARYR